MFSKIEIEQSVEEWLSPQAEAKLTQTIKQKILSERRERVIKNPGSTIDYGYSFQGLTDVRQSCLKEVRTYYKTNGKRPYVADIGAGFGNMTWKLLTAGARVDAIEVQKPTAEELSRRLRNMDSTFWENASIDDILTVYATDAVSLLEENNFREKYDFIWLGNIVHFLTPEQIKKLNQIFQHVLKPDGKIFAEMNSLSTFSSMPNYCVLQDSYENAKKKGVEFPGFIAFNGATLLDETEHRVVVCSLISAFDMEDMKKLSIPLQTNAYGDGYLGPTKAEETIEKSLYANANPRHQLSINRFHQVMTLFNESTAKELFSKGGFECIAYGLNQQGHQVSSNNHDGVFLAIVLQKAPNLVLQLNQAKETGSYVNLSFINSTPHHQLLLDAERLCENNKHYDSYLKAIRDKDYSLALRKASAVGSLPLVQILLKYKYSLNIDINKPSQNGNTALDWIKVNNQIEPSVKEKIITLLLENNAQSGSIIKTNVETPQSKA